MKSKLFFPIYFLCTIAGLIVLQWVLASGNFQFNSVDGYDIIVIHGIDLSYWIFGIALMQLIGLAIMITSCTKPDHR